MAKTKVKTIVGYTIQITCYTGTEQTLHTIKDLKAHGNIYETQEYYTDKYLAKGYDRVKLNVIQELYTK